MTKCGRYGGQEKCTQTFCRETRMKQTTWNLSIYDRIVLTRILKKYNGREWTGLIWLRMGTSGGLL
jgi:hypothetical protein